MPVVLLLAPFLIPCPPAPLLNGVLSHTQACLQPAHQADTGYSPLASEARVPHREAPLKVLP